MDFDNNNLLLDSDTEYELLLAFARNLNDAEKERLRQTALWYTLRDLDSTTRSLSD